jgi:hypothetical protein
MQRISTNSNAPVKNLFKILACAAALVWGTPAVQASSISFVTNPQVMTANLGGYLINATATFDINTTAKTITVHLLNNLIDPTDEKQAIGSVRFNIGTSATLAASPLQSESYTTFDISSTGTPTTATAVTTGSPWQVLNTTGTQIALCVVCTAGATKDLILGGPASNLKYTSPDTTLKSTSARWIIGSGALYTKGNLKNVDASPDFVIHFNTSIDNVVISNVFIGFGEAAGYGDESFATETPEPDSVILFLTGLGLIGFAVGSKRIRRS